MKNSSFPIASLCIFGFDGTAVPDWIRFLITDKNLGGVILFKRNIESKEQLTQLICELRSFQKETPLFISVDHEGGRVFRLPPPFTKIPTARQIGIEAGSSRPPSGDLDPLPPFHIGSLMGRELREVGFNLNYAPVLDVDTNPHNPIIGDRSFGSDPHQVATLALEVASGLRAEKIIPCGKHFPGHGDTSRDSHLELPVVDHPLSRLEQIELVPFQAAIQQNLEMIMTAHVLYPQIDPDYPATLSRKIITDLLRNRLGYRGVVISDDLLMKAISEGYGTQASAVRFLQAGGDVVLMCREEQSCLGVLENLEKSLRDQELNEPELNLSLKRVNVLKGRIKNPKNPQNFRNIDASIVR